MKLSGPLVGAGLVLAAAVVAVGASGAPGERMISTLDDDTATSVVSSTSSTPTTSTTSTTTTTSTTVAAPATTAPPAVAGSGVAVRGPAVQLTPTLPPPTTTIPRDSCPAGSLIRQVDTGGEQLVAFTFDDGPSLSNTRPIMQAFEARDMTATFFVVGQAARAYPSLMQEIVDRGFFLANHSISHQYSPSIIAREIAPMNRIIEAYTGTPTVYFRSPGLTQGSVIQSTLASLGMCNIFTSVDLRDWVSPRRSASQLCSSFSATLHPGMIVLLHDGGNYRPTTAAVPCMLDVATSRGYRVVSLGELLRSGQPKFGFSGDFSPRDAMVWEPSAE